MTVRYRRPAGSVPPLTDAVGHLLAIDPLVRVRTKTGAVVEFGPADVVALRVLTDTPVRTSAIRALEHAAAAAWPGAEQDWLDGWLLRAGHGIANSAVPLDISAHIGTIPAIAAWYERRGLAPRLAVPDRLLPLPPGLTGEHAERVLVRDVSAMDSCELDPFTSMAARPDEVWLRIYGEEIPVDELTAVTGGELAFGALGETAVARAAVTDAPDGTRWVGLSAIRAEHDAVAARGLCAALLAWGADRGATRGYLVLPDAGVTNLADALGFRLHHRRRYIRVEPSAWDTV